MGRTIELVQEFDQHLVSYFNLVSGVSMCLCFAIGVAAVARGLVRVTPMGQFSADEGLNITP